MSKIVERTLDVFELFAQQRRPLALSDLKRLLGIPISSCHDVVQALQARGYLYEIAPRAGYYPTVRLHDMCKVISEHDPLVLRAEASLELLRDKVNETVMLSRAMDSDIDYLLVLETTSPLKYSVTVGQPLRSLYATSAGKAYLGSLTTDEFENFLGAVELVPLTRHTITSKEELRAEIEMSNRRGWYLNTEESVEGLLTTSARFVWNDISYIITVAGPIERMQDKLDHVTGALVGTCMNLDQRRIR